MGITRQATIRSATAREKTRLFPMVLKFLSMSMAVMTKRFPTTVIRIKTSNVNDNAIEPVVNTKDSVVTSVVVDEELDVDCCSELERGISIGAE